MITLYKKIATHNVEISSYQEKAIEFINNNFSDSHYKSNQSDIKIRIVFGYGSPFVDYNVYITRENKSIIFKRPDYMIEADENYSSAVMFVNNELALKHALMNLYSSFIVYHNWGLLIHSSCAVEDGKAHVFAGYSGAGKSTAAKLSQPRELLSDEATLVRIEQEEIKIFNSPFRSEINDPSSIKSATLKSIQLLKQSKLNDRTSLKKSDALVELMDKVFYWAHDSEETKKAIGLLRMLVERIEIYELYFKKDDTFWELIS